MVTRVKCQAEYNEPIKRLRKRGELVSRRCCLKRVLWGHFCIIIQWGCNKRGRAGMGCREELGGGPPDGPVLCVRTMKQLEYRWMRCLRAEMEIGEQERLPLKTASSTTGQGKARPRAKLLTKRGQQIHKGSIPGRSCSTRLCELDFSSLTFQKSAPVQHRWSFPCSNTPESTQHLVKRQRNCQTPKPQSAKKTWT